VATGAGVAGAPVDETAAGFAHAAINIAVTDNMTISLERISPPTVGKDVRFFG
jgi:hypothetical protein